MSNGNGTNLHHIILQRNIILIFFIAHHGIGALPCFTLYYIEIKLFNMEIVNLKLRSICMQFYNLNKYP